MNGDESAANNKDALRNKLNSFQIAAGQERAKELVAQGQSQSVDMALELTGRKGVFIRCDLRGNQALFESGFGQDAIGFNEDCPKRLIIFCAENAGKCRTKPGLKVDYGYVRSLLCCGGRK
jgi:hypothetical protein